MLTRDALRRVFLGRCFYLFVTLLALIATSHFVDAKEYGILVRYMVGSLVMLAAVAAVGRSVLSFVVVLALAGPALGLRWLSNDLNSPPLFDLALRFDAAVYAATIFLLLRYVFDREVLTTDRLWGAASAYLMIGVFWGSLYAIIDHEIPSSFAIRGAIQPLQLLDLLYFSFGTLTTSGYGDVLPQTPIARTASMIEGIVGQLFIAILIARLVGVYPQSEK